MFAVNFAPAVCGPLLDWLGPCALAVSGSAVATLGMVLLAVARSGGPDAFAGGAFCIGAFCTGVYNRLMCSKLHAARGGKLGSAGPSAAGRGSPRLGAPAATRFFVSHVPPPPLHDVPAATGYHILDKTGRHSLLCIGVLCL